MVLRYEAYSEAYNLSAFSNFDCKDSTYDKLYRKLRREFDALCAFPKQGCYPGKTIECSRKDGMGVTYLVYDDDIAVGFFTLASNSLTIDDDAFTEKFREFIPPELSVWKPTKTFPAIRITQLAVDRKYQNGYLKEHKREHPVDITGRKIPASDYVMEKIFDAVQLLSKSVGIRYIIVDALAVPRTVAYYERYDFEPFPRDIDLFKILKGKSYSNNHDHDAVSMYLDLNRDNPFDTQQAEIPQAPLIKNMK